MTNIYNYDRQGLEALLTANNIPIFIPILIWNWLYFQLVSDIDQMKNLDKKTLVFL